MIIDGFESAEVKAKIRCLRNAYTQELAKIQKSKKSGASDMLLKELAIEDPDSFKKHLRMSSNLFKTLLQYITPSIEKQNTIMRDALPAS